MQLMRTMSGETRMNMTLGMMMLLSTCQAVQQRRRVATGRRKVGPEDEKRLARETADLQRKGHAAQKPPPPRRKW